VGLYYSTLNKDDEEEDGERSLGRLPEISAGFITKSYSDGNGNLP
jgi:hypothetical protein